jgi:hypothetical protein
MHISYNQAGKGEEQIIWRKIKHWKTFETSKNIQRTYLKDVQGYMETLKADFLQ